MHSEAPGHCGTLAVLTNFNLGVMFVSLYHKLVTEEEEVGRNTQK